MLGEFMGQKQFTSEGEAARGWGGGPGSRRRYVQVSSCAKLYAYNLLPVKCKSLSLHVKPQNQCSLCIGYNSDGSLPVSLQTPKDAEWSEAMPRFRGAGGL